MGEKGGMKKKDSTISTFASTSYLINVCFQMTYMDFAWTEQPTAFPGFHNS